MFEILVKKQTPTKSTSTVFSSPRLEPVVERMQVRHTSQPFKWHASDKDKNLFRKIS